MGLYSLMTTSASGMSAQSAWLNAISDNVANVSTTGYKQATTEFSSLVLNSDLPSDYQSGSVIVDPQVADQWARDAQRNDKLDRSCGSGKRLLRRPRPKQSACSDARGLLHEERGRQSCECRRVHAAGIPVRQHWCRKQFLGTGSDQPEQHRAADDPHDIGQALCQCCHRTLQPSRHGERSDE